MRIKGHENKYCSAFTHIIFHYVLTECKLGLNCNVCDIYPFFSKRTTGVIEVLPQDLQNVIKKGWLLKKRKEKVLFGSDFNKCYCVIAGNIFYYYEKETDAKPSGKISNTGS